MVRRPEIGFFVRFHHRKKGCLIFFSMCIFIYFVYCTRIAMVVIEGTKHKVS